MKACRVLIVLFHCLVVVSLSTFISDAKNFALSIILAVFEQFVSQAIVSLSFVRLWCDSKKLWT
jgi:hypothetical protein